MTNELSGIGDCITWIVERAVRDTTHARGVPCLVGPTG